MNKMSHRLFALGISSAFAFFLEIRIIALPLLLAISYLVGSLPDIDLRLGVQHRGFTHTILFFFIGTFVSAIGFFYLYWFMQQIMGASVFGIEPVYYDGFPIPAFFTLIFSDPLTAFTDEFFKYLIFFLAAYMSHFVLDLITPAGLSLGSVQVGGVIDSSSKSFNMFFTSLGLMTTLFSLTFIVLRELTVVDIKWSTWYFISVGLIMIIVVIVSILYRRGKGDDNLACFKLDNNIEICLPEGKCFKVGADKDDKICNIPGFDL